MEIKLIRSKSLHLAASPIGIRLRPAGSDCNGSLRIRDMNGVASMRLSSAIHM